jgi:hypothetical protein
MSAKRTVELKDALPILAENKQVRSRLREEFGVATQRAMLKKMRERDIEDEAGADAHDFLLDEIGNESDIVWAGYIPANDDEYPVHIKRYGGVYVAWSMEYDDEGYFLCFADAMDYLEDNWPWAIMVTDDSPTLRKRGIEREKADAYLQRLEDEKAHRIRWSAPPPPASFAWWIDRIQQPLPEDIDSRIALTEQWLAEPVKPCWRSHSYMATTEMPILIRLLGDEAATEALLRGLKEQRPELAEALVAFVIRTGNEAARYFQKPWPTYGYGSIASIAWKPLYRVQVTIGLRVQAIAEKLGIPIPEDGRIGDVPYHDPDAPINGGYQALETGVPSNAQRSGGQDETGGGQP